MRSILLLLIAFFALPVVGAFAQQDACSDQYGACIERCTKRAPNAQDECIATCQSGSNACYGKMWGAPPSSSAVNVAPAGAEDSQAAASDKAAASR